ncbi:MAG: LytTR family DNA-binding domain-containing protein [Bacteroidota bacterium]
MDQELRYWINELADQQFFRIHKSYVVNTAKILKVAGNQAYLSEQQTVPIGRAYKDKFMRAFVRL